MALAAIQYNPIAVTALIAAPGAVYANTTLQTYTFANQWTKVILLRRWYNLAAWDYLTWTRSGGNLPGYGAPGIKYGPTYNNTGTSPMDDDATGNNVRACNGLARANWDVSRTLYVRYLPVL
jgi:hypothetical protein